MTDAEVTKLAKFLDRKAKEFICTSPVEQFLSGKKHFSFEHKPIEDCLKLIALNHLLRREWPGYMNTFIENDVRRRLSFAGHPTPYTIGDKLDTDYPELEPFQAAWLDGTLSL